ncbi:hypothetical protein BHE74_00009301 [Ensete ventricosum]|nr:hypothetical protein BHE74_00009301 [Ensete ventricosum]
MLAARTSLYGSTGRSGGPTTFGAKRRTANVTRALDACQSWRGCPSRNPTNHGRSLPTPTSIPSIWRWNTPYHTHGRYWSLLNDPGLTPPRPNPRTPVVTPEAFQGLTNQVQAIAGMLQADDSVWHLRCHNHPTKTNCRIPPRDETKGGTPWTIPRPLHKRKGWKEVNRPSAQYSAQLHSNGDLPLDTRKGTLKDSQPIEVSSRDRDRRRYCHFQCNYEHDTEECYNLKNQIEDPIHRDHLDRYIRKPREPSLHPKGSVERHIDVIVGGPTAGGISSSARKAYARAENQKRPQPRGDPGFTFEPKSEYPDHDDALVVTARIANACFTGDAITRVGVVTLPVTFDDEPRTKTLMFSTNAGLREIKSDAQELR